MLKYILILLLIFPYLLSANANEKVILQLKWEHEFQFAGYYAADWQGFYNEAGIDVEIRSVSRDDGTIVKPMEELGTGRADFAVGSLDILSAKDFGVDPVILASFFQRSPSAIFTLKNTPAANINQLSKLRIAAVKNDATKMEIEALFKTNGFDIEKIQFVDEAINIDTLINYKADAIVTYEISAAMQANQKGVELNKFHPADHGLDFYADTLFTSKNFAINKPKLTRKFVEATKKGWLYALQNKKEIAEGISTKLKRNLFQYESNLEYNLAFSEYIDSLIQLNQFPIGNVNQEKWFAMSERLYGLNKNTSRIDGSNILSESEQSYNYQQETILGLILISLVLLSFYFWYQKNLIITLSLIFIIGISIAFQLETNIRNEQSQLEKINLLSQLSSISAKLKGNLETNLSILTGFAAYISINPELTFEEFEKFAKEVFKNRSVITNFAAAKDLVVNYVYPYEQNKRAIGLDYRKNLAQRDMAFQVVNTGQLLVAGPVNLVQGGIAFIGRAPVYIGDGEERRSWGIISAPLDAESLYQQSDIYKFSNMSIAIKSFDSLGQEAPVFFGDKNIFQNVNRVELTIQVGGGSWRIAAILNNDAKNSNLPTNIKIIRVVFLFVFLMICLFSIYRFKEDKIKRNYEKEMLVNKKMLEKVNSVAKIGGWEIDSQLNITHWPSQTSFVLSLDSFYRPKNLAELAEIFDSESFDHFQKKINNLLKSDSNIDIELRIKRDLSQQRWIRVIANSVPNSDETFLITGTMQDVTEKVISAKIIERQATFDPLTNLPNRVLFNQKLSQAIENAHRIDGKIAVLFIDLDRFKPVNDNHGHEIGDRLLIEAALRIQKCVRETDTVSRISGDEFGVVLTNIKTYNDAALVSEQILQALQKNYLLKDVSVFCGASIGISFYPDDSHNADELLRNADQAMYEVKGQGRNGWHFYTREMQQKSEYRHQLLNDLILAINKNELSVYFQPIIDIKQNKITKCESLARWQKSDGQFVSPVEFIGLAEESGLVNRIDLFMLNQSAIIMQKINLKIARVGISINVSPRLFQCKENELDNWLACVKLFSLHTEVTVEITERLLTEDSDKALSILSELRKLGVKIAIDDFGIGYSSLNYLVKFPVDIIKVDRSFIKNIGIDKASETMIKTMIVMAHELKIDVVAEGVETIKQLDFLECHGCDFGQGYYFSKPLDELDFSKLINEVET